MCTGANEDNERKSSERTSGIGGRQSNIGYQAFNLAGVLLIPK